MSVDGTEHTKVVTLVGSKTDDPVFCSLPPPGTGTDSPTNAVTPCVVCHPRSEVASGPGV